MFTGIVADRHGGRPKRKKKGVESRHGTEAKRRIEAPGKDGDEGGEKALLVVLPLVFSFPSHDEVRRRSRRSTTRQTQRHLQKERYERTEREKNEERLDLRELKRHP